MDTKRFITVMVLSIVLVFGWQLLWPRFVAWQYDRHPTWKRPEPVAVDDAANSATQPIASTVPATTTATTTAVASQSATGPSTNAAQVAVERPTATTAAASPTTTSQPAPPTPPQVAAADALQVVNTTPTTETKILGSIQANDEQYVMGLKLSGVGGGLDEVTLNHYREPLAGKELYTFQSPYVVADSEASRPLATRKLLIRDGTGRERDIDLAGKVWQLENYSPADQSASYVLRVGESPQNPLVLLRKTYRVYPATSAEHPGGYEATLDFTLENLTQSPLTIEQNFNGLATPPRELDRGGDRQVMVGYWNGNKLDVERHPVEEFAKEKATQEVQKYKDKDWPMSWTGTASAYFNAIVQLRPPQGQNAFTPLSQVPRKKDKPDELDLTNIKPSQISPIDKVICHVVNPGEANVDLREVATEIQTVSIKVLPREAYSLPTLTLFLGPRDRSLLDQKPYNVPPRDYFETLNIATGPCAVCTFAWLVTGLSRLLWAFHWVLRDWGLAIIALVAVVRLCLHPITKKSQISMQRMQKMQPEIERLKKKYGDNKEELNKAMMQVYKETGVAPLLGCLPMVLQMPIWIALYTSLQTNIELRQAPFLWNLTWIHNLARPDRMIAFDKSIPLIFGMSISAINILPLLMAVVMYLQQKMQPKPPTLDPQQASTQKMMLWMSVLMFPLFLYNGPSGLNLYILTSTAIGIIESKVVRNHIKQREEAEKAGRVLVEAKPTRAGRRMAEDAKREQPVKEGWMARLQRKAEEMQNEAQKRKKKGR